MKKILFVCTGNTCRSPMAEAILKKKFRDMGVKNVKVSSAGLLADEGAEMSAYARAALRENAVRPYAFRSRLLTAAIVREQWLVIVMTEQHRAALRAFPNVRTIASLTGGGDIPDPYGGTMDDYRATFRALDAACGEIAEAVKKTLEVKKK